MLFSLRVICSRANVKITKQRVAGLMNYLSLSDDCAFAPYWKDNECAILELNTTIDNPDYSKIRQHIQLISGAENISDSFTSDGWECSYFASIAELHSNKVRAFVVCNVF